MKQTFFVGIYIYNAWALCSYLLGASHSSACTGRHAARSGNRSCTRPRDR